MKKIVAGLLFVLSIILGFVFFKMHQNTDTVPPVITLPEEEAVYEEGMDKVELLKGVSATDDVDGDVSDSLMVESIIPMDDGQSATVIYYAKDRSNNVTKATRIVTYRPADMEEWMMEETETETEQETETVPVFESREEGGEESATEEETLEGEAPVLELSVKEVRVPKGSRFEPLAYVKDIRDNKDDRSHLFGQIHIDSNTVNTSVPGTYEVVFSVTDSDNYSSEQEVLKVIVEE